MTGISGFRRSPRDVKESLSMADGTTRVRIACAQMEPRIGEAPRNIRRSLEFIGEAAGAGADLVVLPELCASGYVFQSRAETLEAAEASPRALAAWREAAEVHGIHVVAGFCERSGDRLYNSAAVIGPDGFVGIHRKLHLWDAENRFFERGDRGMPVFETRLGRLAAAICYDIWFPEVFRLAALQGADILCVPTNWVPMPDQPPDMPAMANVLAMAGAHVNSLVVAAADRVGTERGQLFLGRSLIVGHTGWPLAGPASPDREEIIHAEADLAERRRRHRWNAFNDPIENRRTDLYGDLSKGVPAAAH
jgi:predicted amidohydrolase